MNNSSYWVVFRVLAITLLMAQSFLGTLPLTQDQWWVVIQGKTVQAFETEPDPSLADITASFDIEADGTAAFDNGTDVTDPAHSTDCSWSTRSDDDMWNGTNENWINNGLDSCENNGIVRLNDAVIYRSDIAINDADQENVTAIFTLPDTTAGWNNRAMRLEIPEVCLVGDYTNDAGQVVSYAPQSSISADGTVLICNVWHHVEWTKLVVYPKANANPFNQNDDNFDASVCVNSDQHPTDVCPDPINVIVTSTFGIDLTKDLNPPHKPEDGAPHVAKIKVWPDAWDWSGQVLQL